MIGLDANQTGGNDIAFDDIASQAAKVTANGVIINAIGTGTEGMSPQYSAGYIATRYLHWKLKLTMLLLLGWIKDMLAG